MLKDTLKYDLLKYKSDTEIEYYKSNEVYRIYSLGQGYLLLSVCKYIRDKKWIESIVNCIGNIS